jgi:hypothetical protein
MHEEPHHGIDAESAGPYIKDYHDFLTQNPELAAESQALLERLSYERLLTFGGKPFSRYLRPHLITRSQHAEMVRVIGALASAFIKLRRALLVSPRLLDELDLTPQERHLALLDPGFEEPSPSARLDSFWSERNWQFVEMNAESPASIAYCDVLGEAMLELPALRRWSAERGFQLSNLPARERFMQAIEQAYSEFYAHRRGEHRLNERPNIAIVDWEDVPTTTEFELFRRYFEGRGYRTVVVTPQSLRFEGGRLRSGDFEIDLYYKRVLTSELLARPEVAEATLQAYVAGAVCVMNSFRAKLLHKKMSLALISDDANSALFSDEERRAIADHIPWTRKVRPGKTHFEGKEVDLIPFIAENREKLVLKPNDEYGGKGVVIGWDTGDEEWARALDEAQKGSFVVQQAVALDKEPYPFYDEGGLGFRELAADLDPFVFGTDTQGILTRLSAASLLNVTAGTGSVVATIVVER